MVQFKTIFALLATLPLVSYASVIPLSARNEGTSRPLLQNASVEDIAHARRVVRDAIASNMGGVERRSPTPEVQAAAALVAEADAAKNAPFLAPRATPYWRETIAHKGTYPVSWGAPDDYRVYRNVKDYGAKGDGVTDDSSAIRQAIGDTHHGAGLLPAVIYFPSGKYLISDTIPVPSRSQLIGDTNNLPEIIVTSSFIGDSVFETIGSQLIHIRGFQVNMEKVDPEIQLSGVKWRAGKGSGVYKVVFLGNSESSSQRGVTFEWATGGVFTGGWYRNLNVGLYGNVDNIFAQSLTFAGCKTAAHITSGFESVFTNLHVVDSDVAIRLHGEDNTANPSSVTLRDTYLQNVKTGVLVAPLEKDAGSSTPGITIENVGLNNVQRVVANTSGATILGTSGRGGEVAHWAVGTSYKNEERSWLTGNSSAYPRESSMLYDFGQWTPKEKYSLYNYPVWDTATADTFVHMKDYGAKGDGSTDDTKAVQAAFDAVADGTKILFVDSGVYMISSTVTVPKDARVVGEAWATIAGYGDRFADPGTPTPVLQVGNENDVGKASISGLTITTQGSTAGAIMIYWNVQSATMMDVHVRIGGSIGSKQTAAECPSDGGKPREECRVAAALLYITPKSSGMFENMILSIADHDLRGDPITLYGARGVIVESRKPTWLYSISAENSVLYQYNINSARNVAGAALQSKSPVFQPNPAAPTPFDYSIGNFNSDPQYQCKGDDFDGCDSAWAGIIQESQQVILAGVVSYSSYANRDEACVEGLSCQKALWSLNGNYANVRVQQLATVGAKYSLVSDNKGVSATENLVSKSGLKWSQVSIYDGKPWGLQLDN